MKEAMALQIYLTCGMRPGEEGVQVIWIHAVLAFKRLNDNVQKSSALEGYPAKPFSNPEGVVRNSENYTLIIA